jgi:polysaccharide export outer membrane protein
MPFVMLEIGPAVADTLARAKPPSFAGDFADCRPAHRQLIGIGDWVQITPWEAWPGGLFSAPVVDRTNAGSRPATIPDQVVARDQAITVPFAGRIVVAGRTPPEGLRAAGKMPGRDGGTGALIEPRSMDR